MENGATNKSLFSEVSGYTEILLALLQNAFDRRESIRSPKHTSDLSRPTSAGKPTKNKNDVPPISLAMQLVSATAAFYQECKITDDQQRYYNEENDRIIGKIPHDATHFDNELLGHVRTLIIRAIISVCSAALEEESNIEELSQGHIVQSVIQSSKSLLQTGGFAALDDQSSVTNGHDKSTPQVEISASTNRISDMLLSEINEIVYKTLKKLMHIISNSVNPVTKNSSQITDVVSLLQEFDRCGGYDVLERVFCKIAEKLSPNHHGAEGRPVSPLVAKSPKNYELQPSPLGSANELVTGSVRHRHPSSTQSKLELKLRSLLKTFEEMFRVTKRSKTEYIHKVTCQKRSHRHCDLSLTLHQHHDIMGLGVSKYANSTKSIEKVQNKSRWSVHGPSWGSESPKKSKKKHKTRSQKDEPPPLCTVARAISFLLDRLYPNHKSCTKIILTSVDRIGTCHCAKPSTILVPLLSSIPNFPPNVHDVILATVGRIILQRMNTVSGKEKSARKEEKLVTLELPLTLSTVKNIEPDNDDVTKIQRINPFNLPDSPKHRSFNSPSKYPVIPNSVQYERVLNEYEDFTWLCLATYRDLILPQNDFPGENSGQMSTQEKRISLSIKVASHLSTISQHFDLDPLLNLITTVILPVLRASTGLSPRGSQSSPTRGRKHRENYLENRSSDSPRKRLHHKSSIHPQIIIHCLEILKYHFGRSSDVRKMFIRHSGIRPLTALLSRRQNISISVQQEARHDLLLNVISKEASSALTFLLSNATPLSPDARILYLHENLDEDVKSPRESPRMKRKNNPENEDSGMLQSIMRGFSPLRSISPKQKHRLSPFRSKNPSNEDAGGRCYFSWMEQNIDEVVVLHSDIHYFLSYILQEFSELTSEDDDLSEGNSESEDTTPGLIAAPAGSSDTTGYQSRDSSLPSNKPTLENDASSSDDDDSVLNIDFDGIILPVNDSNRMQIICDYSALLSSVLQDNMEARNAFMKLDGPEMTLRLLTLVTTSLIPTNARLDFTTGSSETSSIKSFLQSVEEQSKSKDLSTPTTLQSNLQSYDSEKLVSSEYKDVTPKQESSKSSGDKEVSFMQDLVHDKVSDDDTTRSMAMKFQLLSTTLSISLLSFQNDITSDDIISTLKPLLQQSRLTATKYCHSLCKSLFEALVETEQPNLEYTSINSTMSSLKQQMLSPRKSTPSPGNLQKENSLLFFPADFSSTGRFSSPGGRDSLESVDLNLSEADDSSSVYDMMLNIDRALGSDEESSNTDGYQGDSESDKPEIPFSPLSGRGATSTPDQEVLVNRGKIVNPKLTCLMVQLLGDAGDSIAKASERQQTLSAQTSIITHAEHTDNIRAVLHTITSLLKYSRENLDKMLSGSDFPLACLESFKDILQFNNEEEKDIRKMILELCLTLNNHRMSAKHLRLILSFFNSANPPMEQLLQYLLLLIQHQHPGPSQYLQFPVNDELNTQSNHRYSVTEATKKSDEPFTLSVWKVAPLRLPIVSSIHWPASNIGITISLWIKLGLSRESREKSPVMESWESDQVVVVDIDHTMRKRDSSPDDPSVVAPYHHLVSVGTRHKTLQVWLENGTLIFKVCIDSDDSKPIGVLTQTQCNGLLLTNGEWQHLTLNYTENRLPDKTILGKVHAIVNCTTERDIILEHNMPKQSARRESINRKTGMAEPRKVSLFLGHYSRSSKANTYTEEMSGYKLGTVMLFEGIYFTLKSAFAIFRRGPNINNLTDCLVSDTDFKKEKKSSASVSSRIRLSRSPSHIVTPVSSPFSPTPGLESANNPHFYLLPHSLLLSDVVTEDFFSLENMPSVKNLQEHLVLTYSPTDVGIYLSNSSNVASTEPDRRSRSFSLFSTSPSTNVTTVPSENFDPLIQQFMKMPVKKLVKFRSQWNRGLHKALNQVGGIQVFLLLCAKVVEVTSSTIRDPSSLEERREAEKIQCLALQSLLKLRSTDSKRQQEFTSLNVAAMLHKLLTKSECIVGFRTLQIIFNASCSGDEVIVCYNSENNDEKGDFYEVNFENSALIHDQELLQFLLTDWKIWYKSVDLINSEDSDDLFPVWSMLLQAILSLVRVEHPHQWFNSKALLRAGIVHRILTGLQQMIADGVDPFPGQSVTSHMIELLRAVIGSPPSINILSKICDFLVATHPPASTFVCHTTSSFYFNLKTSENNKDLGQITQSLPHSPTSDDPNAMRPLLNRSVSAPAKSLSPKRKVETLLSTASKAIAEAVITEEREHHTDGLKEDSLNNSSVGNDTRKIKALSIIEEGNSSGSGNSSRNTTPSHLKSIASSRSTFTMSTRADGGNDSSWEEVPHNVNPVLTSPKEDRKGKTSSGGKDEKNDEEIRFVMQKEMSGPSSKYSSMKSVNPLDVDDNNELCYVTCELLNLLRLAVMTMPDIDAFELTAGPLCAKALVVGVHHKSSDVRASTLRMLAVYFSKCSPKAQEEFLKEKGFHLVANQLHQHPATRPLLDACLYFLLGHPISSAEVLPLDGTAPDPAVMPTPAPDPFTNHAAVLLLAVLGNTVHDYDLCRDVVTRLQELFECMGPIADVMLDNGLTLALCNLITTVLSPSCILEEYEKEGIIEEVEHFMTCIAVKACVTAGAAHFQVFEDLFTLLDVIENDQYKNNGESMSRNIARIQSLSYHIISMVLELMQKSAGGKSPMVPRKFDSVSRSGPNSLHSTSSMQSSRRSSNAGSHIAGDYNQDENTFASLDSEQSVDRKDNTSHGADVFDRRSSLMTSSMYHHHLKSKSHKRSHSITHSLSSSESNVLFRSTHGGGLRTRSFKGSQRRRINEAETARRFQRVIMIAVDKIVYNESKVYDANSDKDTTFATGISPSSSINKSHQKYQDSDVFSGDRKEDFSHHLFHNLIEWLSNVLTGGPRPAVSRNRPSSRYSTSSSLAPSTISQGWERILMISRESLLDQTIRLFVHLMSPWQLDLRVRTLPLSIAQRQNAERLLTTLFPKDSKNSKKVSVYLHYLLCYYKQQMTSQERKDTKIFCRLFHKCGHTVYPLLQNTNGVGNKSRSLSSSVVEKEKTTENTQTFIVENIEKSQALFDSERQRDIKNRRKQNHDAYLQLKLRTDHLSQVVSQHAMDVTQQVVLRQNIERKKMIAHMKDVTSNDLSVRKQWANLLEQLAHERAVWYDESRYPKSWQLDATEGPNRERRRLQRCHLNIDERFMMKKTEKTKNREIERKRNLQEKIREMVENSPNYEKDENLTPTYEETNESEKLMCKRPLSFLFDDDSNSSDSKTIRTRLQTNERISVVQSCTNVTPSSETPGEILIGESNMYFVGNEVITDLSLTQALFGECEVLVLSWRHEEVAEVHKRWWQLRDIAIEIFLTNGKTYLFAFKSAMERDIIDKKLKALSLPNMLVQDNDLSSLTQMWRNGQITNFEYLTHLNKTAGRSFNDLMQYPVMPFVLADYTSAILDLNNVESFRNLLRPISVPDDIRKKHYQDRYEILSEDYNNCTDDEREMKTPPSHYGSHYSNSGTVLHFLVRVPPYTQMFLEYQDASFDIPDRTFHSMETTFRLSSYSSTTDVKELTPEFFFLPEFLCNLEGFDFGIRQCGLRVNHVTLPSWSKADPRLFILIHRQALESDYVSANLHGWIDLVFGYKQRGKEAIDAINVFHPATYFGMDVSQVEDPVKRKALETMIKTYGQTPKQLFMSPHPPKNIKTEMKDQVPQGLANNGSRRSSLVPPGRSTPSRQISVKSDKNRSSIISIDKDTKAEHSKVITPQRPLASVLGLKWGHYLGSPSAPDPVVFLNKPLSEPVGSLIPLQTNDVCALSPKMGLLVIYNKEREVRSYKTIDIKWSALLTYGHPDNVVRLKMKKSLPDINLFRTPADDRVTCCSVAPDCRAIVLGHRTGAIIVNKCNPLPDKAFDLEFQRSTTLYGHFGEITCLVTCGEFRILASGSKDGTVVLWDLDALTYIRSLTGHATSVSSLAVSRTSGDVCTVCDSGNNEGSHIRLWTINGSLLAAQDTKQRVGCVSFSSAPEGISVNVVAGGMSNGVIRLWSSWDLTPIQDISTPGVDKPISCITYTHNSEVLYAATCDGYVLAWCFKDKTEDKKPILISFLNVGERS
ncbi:lysosomal-trafficking regulator-like [Styela clava]